MRNKQSGYIRFLNRSIETKLPLSMKKKNPPSQLEKNLNLSRILMIYLRKIN